jgi:hypothetical protein
MLSLPMG